MYPTRGFRAPTPCEALRPDGILTRAADRWRGVSAVGPDWQRGQTATGPARQRVGPEVVLGGGMARAWPGAARRRQRYGVGGTLIDWMTGWKLPVLSDPTA